MPITGYDLKERKEYAQQAGIAAVLQYKKEHPEVDEVQFITPFDVCPESDLTYAEYIGRDITALMQCDVAGFCEGWRKSRGCRLERSVAYQMKIPAFNVFFIAEKNT